MGDENKDDANKGLEELTKKLEVVVGVVQKLGEQNQALQQNFVGLTDKLDGLATGKKDDQEDDDDDVPGIGDADLENLDRKGFLEVILTSVNKSVNKAVGSLEEQINGVSTNINTDKLKVQLQEMANSHKDFKDWGPEIKALAQENPTLSPKRLYALARNENPEKAKELDEKYAEEDAGKDDKPVERKGGFGGLTPTSGSVDDKPTNMKQAEAAEAAFEEVFAELRAILRASPYRCAPDGILTRILASSC